MNSKNKSLQLIRIISMLSIVTCHILINSKNMIIYNLSHFFDVGVFVFLILSGYLYSDKEIRSGKDFFKRKFTKLILPVYIYGIIVISLSNITIYSKIKNIAVVLTNTESIFKTTNGINHLWFITIILVCYSFLILLKKNTKILDNIYNYIPFILMSIFLLLSFVNARIASIFIYLLTFYIGMIIKKDCVKKKHTVFISSMVAITSILIRVIFKFLMDETIFYNIIISNITHMMLAGSLFVILFTLFEKFKYCKQKINKCIDYIDSITYYIYITHYSFLVGPIYKVDSINIKIIYPILFTIISAVILKKLTEHFKKLYSSKHKAD